MLPRPEVWITLIAPLGLAPIAVRGAWIALIGPRGLAPIAVRRARGIAGITAIVDARIARMARMLAEESRSGRSLTTKGDEFKRPRAGFDHRNRPEAVQNDFIRARALWDGPPRRSPPRLRASA